MQKILSTFMLLGLFAGTLAVGACNTVDGAGQDIEHAGESVQRAAD